MKESARGYVKATNRAGQDPSGLHNLMGQKDMHAGNYNKKDF